MVRLIFLFFVVINVIIALWVNGLAGRPNNIEPPKGASKLQGDRLILIQEVDPSQLISLKASGSEEEVLSASSVATFIEEPIVEDENAGVVSTCMVLKPFEFRDDAQNLGDQISSFGLTVKLLSEKVESPGPVMVYIKPFVSALEAQRELRVLRASNIDSFIISDGELANGISLGVFRTEQNALALEVEIESLGYEVETNRITVQKDLFSLIVGGNTLDALEDDYWLRIANENKDISIEQKDCNEVASTVNFQ